MLASKGQGVVPALSRCIRRSSALLQRADVGRQRASDGARARLETEEEHAAEVAAAERAAAERKAEKAAAALLAEEAQPRRSERRPQTSGGRGETSAKKRR